MVQLVLRRASGCVRVPVYAPADLIGQSDKSLRTCTILVGQLNLQTFNLDVRSARS